MSNRNQGSLVAMALAGLFAGACASTSSEGPKSAAAPMTTAGVHCTGVNACKGHGSCKGASNACSGQNACKGAGWVSSASADDCTGKGGKVVE